MIGKYHDLWHVEQSFRMSKTDLRARPMFHHTRDAIEAHLTVVFTALAATRYLQAETGVLIGRIVKTLRPLQEISLNIAGHPHTAADPAHRRSRSHPHPAGTTDTLTGALKLCKSGSDVLVSPANVPRKRRWGAN